MRLPCTNVRVSVCEIVIALPILETTAKSVQTTAEVCTDYSWSLQKVLRTYKCKYAYSLKWVHVLTKVFTCTYWGGYVVFISCCCCRRAPTGRYSCIAQGASPGLIVPRTFIEPRWGAAQPTTNTRAESAAPTELILFIICVYPGFCSCLWHSRHPGLCRSVVPMALII